MAARRCSPADLQPREFFPLAPQHTAAAWPPRPPPRRRCLLMDTRLKHVESGLGIWYLTAEPADAAAVGEDVDWSRVQ